MTQNQTLRAPIPSSQAAHDFRLIRGVGPVIDKRLHAAGIRTFSQLAKHSPEEIAALIPHISVKQIREQHWIRQARELAARQRGLAQPKKETTALAAHQHYENFTFEFLLNEKNKIRRLRVTHVQSGDVDTWAEWSPEDLARFLARHMGTRLSHVGPVTMPTNAGTIPSNAILAVTRPPQPTEAESRSDPADFRTTGPISAPRDSGISPPPPTLNKPIDQIRLRKWITSLPGLSQPTRSILHDQIFEVWLTLELDSPTISNGSSVEVMGTLFAKQLGSGMRQMVGQSNASIPNAPVIEFAIPSAGLTKGLYRLEAIVRLGNSDIFTWQGGLLQVY